MAVRADNTGNKLAIVSGSGDLPRLLAEGCRTAGRDYVVVSFEHIPLNWNGTHPSISAVFEQPGKLFAQLLNASCSEVVMAGAMVRASINIEQLDVKGRELAAILAVSAKSGDDRTLTSIIKFFESNNFTVVAAHTVLVDLIPQVGVLTTATPAENEIYDARRAAEIVDALGQVDVGQAAVVRQGICLGLESIQGTDKMLGFVKNTSSEIGLTDSDARGVLLKAPKPGQDLRVDLPAIGPATVQNTFDAGLAGIVIEAGGVMILNQNDTVSLANELGVFLWVRPRE